MGQKAIQGTRSSLTVADLRAELRDAFIGSVGERQVLGCALIFVCMIVFLAHLPALSATAVFLDDSMYAFENPLVLNPSWHSLKCFFREMLAPSSVRGYYQPLTMVSLMVDRFLGGSQDMVRMFHWTSLSLHVANTALVGTFLYVLFGQPLIACAIAMLFGLHPMSVESVCWISERKTVLATFFALLSVIEYIRFARDGKRGHYIVCFVAYVLALLSKPTVLFLPAMMLLMDYWPLHRIRRMAITEKIPLFAAAVASAVVTYVSQSQVAYARLPGQYNPLDVPSILCHNIVFYLRELFWPVDLSPYYDTPSPMSFIHMQVLVGVVGTIVLIALLVILHRWTRAALTGWLIFFVMILPAIGVVRVMDTITANRYAYLPSIGMLMVLAAGAVKVGNLSRHRKVSHAVVVLLILAAAAVEAVPMRDYQTRWKNTLDLDNYTLTVSPRAPGVHCELGVALMKKGDTAGAIHEFLASLSGEPGRSGVRYNLAVALENTPASVDDAICQYEKIISDNSGYVQQAHTNLASMYLRAGRIGDAVSHYRKALEMQMDSPQASYSLGWTLTVSGAPQEGLGFLRQAISLSPTFLLATRDLVWFLATHPNANVRDPNEATRLGEQLQTMTQGRDAGVLDALAAAYALDGQYKRAVETGRKALALATRVRNYELADRIQERLRLYQFECPYYEDPKVQLERMLAKAKRAEDGGQKTEDGGLPTEDRELKSDNSLEISDEAETMQ